MICISVVAIAYILVTHELMRRDKRKNKKGSKEYSCGSCKYFEKTEGSSFFGKCVYFFKPFRAWENACHRYEQKGGSYED